MDILEDTQGTVHGANLFGYGINNPIMNKDNNGEHPLAVVALAAAAVIAPIILLVYILHIVLATTTMPLPDGLFIYNTLVKIQEFVDELAMSLVVAVIKGILRMRSPETRIHHIVAKNASMAFIARLWLGAAKIDIENPLNKIRLNVNFHEYLHTNAYYDAVNVIINYFGMNPISNNITISIAIGLTTIYSVLFFTNLIFFT